jgi:hypothetical protein
MALDHPRDRGADRGGGYRREDLVVSRRMPKELLRKLKSARQSATLQNASFGNFGDETEFVKKLVALHHLTWIIGPLDQVIKWAENEGTEQ